VRKAADDFFDINKLPPKDQFKALLLIISQIGAHSDLQDEQLAQIMKFLVENRRRLYGNIEINEELYHFDFWQLVEAILTHPNVDVLTLTEAMQCDATTIRRVVAKHPKATPEMLLQLASDASSEVRWGVAVNRNTPIEALQLLAYDPISSKIRASAKKNLKSRL